MINQIPTEFPVITVTTPLKLQDEAILPIGHYQVTGEKINNKIYLKLYQGHYLMAQIPAVETLEDYDMPDINFARFLPEENNLCKIIFGSVDFNAYAQIEGADDSKEFNNY